MKDNNDGTITYTKEEVDNINTFLDKVFNKITDYMDKK